MKLIKIFLICILLNPSLHAQNVFPPGVYMSIDELRNRTPAYQADFVVTKRTQGDIGMNGGNDYEIESPTDSIRKKEIKKSIYAYVKNDSLFLNGKHHGLSTWYALAETQGVFIAFSGCMTNSQASEAVMPAAFMFGAIGGGIAGSKAAKKRFPYVLSLRTGNVKPLTKIYMEARLKDFPDINEKFSKEADKENHETLVNYIQLLNEVVPIDMKD